MGTLRKMKLKMRFDKDLQMMAAEEYIADVLNTTLEELIRMFVRLVKH